MPGRRTSTSSSPPTPRNRRTYTRPTPVQEVNDGEPLVEYEPYEGPEPHPRAELQPTWVAHGRVRNSTRGSPVTLRSCFQHDPNYCDSKELDLVPEFSVDGKRSQLGFEHWSGSLKCPVCLDYLQSANVLPCGHTFCRRCIWGMITSRQEEYPHIHPRGLFFFCPTCRHKVMVKNYTKYSPMNVALNSMVDSWLRSDDRLGYFKEPTPASSAPLLSTSGPDDVTINPAPEHRHSETNIRDDVTHPCVLGQRQSETSVRHDVTAERVSAVRQDLDENSMMDVVPGENSSNDTIPEYSYDVGTQTDHDPPPPSTSTLQNDDVALTSYRNVTQWNNTRPLLTSHQNDITLDPIIRQRQPTTGVRNDVIDDSISVLRLILQQDSSDVMENVNSDVTPRSNQTLHNDENSVIGKDVSDVNGNELQ